MALKNDLTKGNLNKQIFFFALPIIISNLFQALYNAVDLYFVAKYLGTAEAVAVSVSGPVMNVLFMAVAGMSLGVTILLGSLVGLGDNQKIKKVANTAISMFLIGAIAITILGLVLTPYILMLISTPQEAVGFAEVYLRAIFTGMVFTLGYNLVCALQRGFGDSKSTMYFVLAATITNIVLDYVFIVKLNMGVKGAAYATVIGQALAFILSIAYFKSRKHIVTFSPKEFTFDKNTAKDIMRIGLPNAMQQATVNVAVLALSGIVNSFGILASAAYGICVKIDNFAVLPCSAVNDAVAAVTSQNLGAGQKERAVEGIKAGRRILVPLNIALVVLIMVFAEPITGIFNRDARVIEMAAKYIRISSLMYVVYAVYYPLMGFIKGTGNAMFTFKNTIAAQLFIRILVAYFCANVLNLGFYGVAVGWIAAPCWSNTIYTIYLKSGKWNKRLEENKAKGRSI